MRELAINYLNEESFEPFGSFFRFDPNPNVRHSRGYAWSSAIAPELVGIEGSASVGLSYGDSLPSKIEKMERHHHTVEALLCAGSPVALVVCDTKGDAPKAEDCTAFVLGPGSMVVMNKGIWHDACRGLYTPTPYYWIATADPSIVDPWVEILGGPISIRL